MLLIKPSEYPKIESVNQIIDSGTESPLIYPVGACETVLRQ